MKKIPLFMIFSVLPSVVCASAPLLRAPEAAHMSCDEVEIKKLAYARERAMGWLDPVHTGYEAVTWASALFGYASCVEYFDKKNSDQSPLSRPLLYACPVCGFCCAGLLATVVYRIECRMQKKYDTSVMHLLSQLDPQQQDTLIRSMQEKTEARENTIYWLKKCQKHARKMKTE